MNTASAIALPSLPAMAVRTFLEFLACFGAAGLTALVFVCFCLQPAHAMPAGDGAGAYSVPVLIGVLYASTRWRTAGTA